MTDVDKLFDEHSWKEINTTWMNQISAKKESVTKNLQGIVNENYHRYIAAAKEITSM
jgi:predicted component of type VI protein secretion system